jgi:hypothetical protein
MDCWEILEEKPRAVEECQQRPVMIGRKRVKAGLDIGEVLLEKDGHIRVKASAVRHGRIGVGAGPRFLNISSLRRLGQPAYGEAMPNIPSNTWQLAGAIRDARGNAREWTAHAFSSLICAVVAGTDFCGFFEANMILEPFWLSSPYYIRSLHQELKGTCACT